jgi:hypothetical protein
MVRVVMSKDDVFVWAHVANAAVAGREAGVDRHLLGE